MAPTGGLFGSQQRPNDNLESSDNNPGTPPNKNSQFREPMNQFHSPPGYTSNPPQQPQCPGAPQFYHFALSNMTQCTQPSSHATQRYSSYRPPWQV